jgi:hypothetical protein
MGLLDRVGKVSAPIAGLDEILDETLPSPPRPPVDYGDDGDGDDAVTLLHQAKTEKARREQIEQRRKTEDEQRRKLEEAERKLEEAERQADPARCELPRLRVLPGLKAPDEVRRVLALIGPSAERIGRDRLVMTCPLCRGTLVLGNNWRDELGVRCLVGCAPADLAASLAGMIPDLERAEYEREAAAEEAAEEAARAAILDECSIAATFEGVGEVTYVIADVLPDAGLTMLVGDTGSRKTFVGMSLALSIAAGRPWLGRDATPGRVMLVLREGSREGHKRRLTRLAAGLGTTLDALRSAVVVYPHPLKTDDRASFEEFVDYVVKIDPRHILIDNLTEVCASSSQASLSDPAYLKSVLNPLRDLAQGEIDGVESRAITLICHANASGGVRGGAGVAQHADHVIYLDAASDRNDSPIEVRRGKSREGVKLATFEIRLVDRPDGALVVERVQPRREQVADEAPVDRDTKRRAEILELLPLSAEDLYNAMRNDHNCGRTVAKRVRDKLEAEGLIAQRDGLWRRVGE